MDISFEGKRVLVTGAGQGIGRGIAEDLCRAGAKVVAVSRTKSYLESLQEEYRSIDFVQLDIGDWDKTKDVIESLGHFDCLVNNAAVAFRLPFLETTSEAFDTIINVNFKSILNISQVVAKKMIENKTKGSIVNISSQTSKVARKDYIIYSAAKADMDAATRAMALELGPYGIRTNSGLPTVIMTPMGRRGWSEPEKADKMISRIPLGRSRSGEVSEVSDDVLYFLTDRASMINGVELPVDGGFLIT